MLPAVNAQLAKRFERTTNLYLELVASLTPELLRSDLRGLPSNTLGAQLWCVVGARESYARAAKAGAWQGFSCRLSRADVQDPEAIRQSLSSTLADLTSLLEGGEPLSPQAEDFLLDLLEHETQHHGQLIRYLYALEIPRPPTWKERYALA
jgi:hypothetical protein